MNFTAGNGDFNPHHPQGGDPPQDSVPLANMDFNPHHPQGGDCMDPDSVHQKRISIHTTRKVVTANHFFIFPSDKISIHTTRKVVTAILHKNHS
ncbi:hypothetical protein [Eisenbergiella tayi]|uniref:hypothetical protein n=1 Tax=Eisenbergiella tayi TaxID=1432052 RepID=UPI003A7F2FAC